MSEFASMFTFMKSGAKAPGGGQYPRLPVGTHEVALRRYYLSQIKTGFAVIAELMVLQSNNPQVRAGEVREWAWFPGTDPYGTEKGRAMQFPETLGRCIGDQRPSDAIGDSMADGHYNGVRVQVQIREELLRDGVTVKRSKAGNVIYAVNWSPVAGQTLESITATKAKMVELEATLPAQVPAQNSFATPTAAPQPAPQPNPFAGYQQQAAPQAAPNPFAGLPQQPPQGAAPNPFAGYQPQPPAPAASPASPFPFPQQSPQAPGAAAPNPLAALFGQASK